MSFKVTHFVLGKRGFAEGSLPPSKKRKLEEDSELNIHEYLKAHEPPRLNQIDRLESLWQELLLDPQLSDETLLRLSRSILPYLEPERDVARVLNSLIIQIESPNQDTLAAMRLHLLLGWLFSNPPYGFSQNYFKSAVCYVKAISSIPTDHLFTPETATLLREAQGIQARTFAIMAMDGSNREIIDIANKALSDALGKGSYIAANTILELINQPQGALFDIYALQDAAQSLNYPIDFLALLTNSPTPPSLQTEHSQPTCIGSHSVTVEQGLEAKNQLKQYLKERFSSDYREFSQAYAWKSSTLENRSDATHFHQASINYATYMFEHGHWKLPSTQDSFSPPSRIQVSDAIDLTGSDLNLSAIDIRTSAPIPPIKSPTEDEIEEDFQSAQRLGNSSRAAAIYQKCAFFGHEEALNLVIQGYESGTPPFPKLIKFSRCWNALKRERNDKSLSKLLSEYPKSEISQNTELLFLLNHTLFKRTGDLKRLIAIAAHYQKDPASRNLAISCYLKVLQRMLRGETAKDFNFEQALTQLINTYIDHNESSKAIAVAEQIKAHHPALFTINIGSLVESLKSKHGPSSLAEECDLPVLRALESLRHAPSANSTPLPSTRAIQKSLFESDSAKLKELLKTTDETFYDKGKLESAYALAKNAFDSQPLKLEELNFLYRSCYSYLETRSLWIK